MSTEPQWKNRRLAARALRVVARTHSLDRTLESYLHTLVPAAEAFIESYDQVRVAEKTRRQALSEAKAVVQTLTHAVRAWAGQVSAMELVEGFSAREYADNPGVPDDVINGANALLVILAGLDQFNEATVPFLRLAVEDIEEKLAFAREAWTRAEAARAKFQLLVESNRAAERKFNVLLVAFRKSLAATVGTASPEYQSLRARKVSRGEKDHDRPAIGLPAEGESSGLEGGEVKISRAMVG